MFGVFYFCVKGHNTEKKDRKVSEHNMNSELCRYRIRTIITNYNIISGHFLPSNFPRVANTALESRQLNNSTTITVVCVVACMVSNILPVRETEPVSRPSGRYHCFNISLALFANSAITSFFSLFC